MDKSKRNRNAGSHPSYKKKGMTPEQIRRKREYDKKYSATEKAKKYRAQLNKANRDAGTYGNGDGKDASHSLDGKKIKMEDQSKNRARKAGVKQTKTHKSRR